MIKYCFCPVQFAVFNVQNSKPDERNLQPKTLNKVDFGCHSFNIQHHIDVKSIFHYEKSG